MSDFRYEMWEVENTLDEFFSSAQGRAVISGAVIVLITITVIALALAVVMYVFQSLSLYKIAKRRGLSLYGFAWVPFLSAYTRRKLLLGFSIGTGVAGIVLNVMNNVFIRQYIWRGAGKMDIVAASFILLVVGLVVTALTITYSVFAYISLYKIYKSCSPASCIVFTVLGILFSVTQPFFLFADRNKDLGMSFVRGLPEETQGTDE